MLVTFWSSYYAVLQKNHNIARNTRPDKTHSFSLTPYSNPIQFFFISRYVIQLSAHTKHVWGRAGEHRWKNARKIVKIVDFMEKYHFMCLTRGLLGGKPRRELISTARRCFHRLEQMFLDLYIYDDGWICRQKMIFSIIWRLHFQTITRKNFPGRPSRGFKNSWTSSDHKIEKMEAKY